MQEIRIRELRNGGLTIQLKQIEPGQAVSRLLGFYRQFAEELIEEHIEA